MCTIIVLNQMNRTYPLIIAANRDEFYARPTRPPFLLSRHPPVFAGQDLEKGGTWLGVTPSGLACGLVNQRTNQHQPDARSRGEIILTALCHQSLVEARHYLDGLTLADYNPFHLLIADHRSAWVMNGHKRHAWHRLPPGISVLTNGGLNSSSFPKVARVHQLLSDLPNDPTAIFERLTQVLADDWTPDEFPGFEGSELGVEIQRTLHAICVKTPQYGTRSSTILALSSTEPTRFLYADGSPRDALFKDVYPDLVAEYASEGPTGI